MCCPWTTSASAKASPSPTDAAVCPNRRRCFATANDGVRIARLLRGTCGGRWSCPGKRLPRKPWAGGFRGRTAGAHPLLPVLPVRQPIEGEVGERDVLVRIPFAPLKQAADGSVGQ